MGPCAWLGTENHTLPAPDRVPDVVRCLEFRPQPDRPEWIAHRDFTPIEPVADDTLSQCAPDAVSGAAPE